MKAYLHMYSGNVQLNPLCPASCVTKDLPISTRFSPTIFYRDANSVLLRAHLCTAVLIGSTRRILSSKLFIRRASRPMYTCTMGMFSRIIYAQYPVSQKNVPISPQFPPTIFYRWANSTLYSAQFFIHSRPN